jgi:tetratricopeptide (TPR) repeat protein
MLAEFIFAITEEKLLDQIDRLKEIIQVEEKYSRAYCAIGHCYMELNRPEDSAKYLRNSISLSPTYAKPRYLLGKLFYKVINYR